MSNSGRNPERRKSKRTKVNFAVIYKVEDPLRVRMMIGDREIQAFMLDLSTGGMAIASDYNIPNGTILWLRFKIINTTVVFNAKDRVKTLKIVGKICSNTKVNDRKQRLGICFTKISNKDKKMMSDFIDSIK